MEQKRLRPGLILVWCGIMAAGAVLLLTVFILSIFPVIGAVQSTGPGESRRSGALLSLRAGPGAGS